MKKNGCCCKWIYKWSNFNKRNTTRYIFQNIFSPRFPVKINNNTNQSNSRWERINIEELPSNCCSSSLWYNHKGIKEFSLPVCLCEWEAISRFLNRTRVIWQRVVPENTSRLVPTQTLACVLGEFNIFQQTECYKIVPYRQEAFITWKFSPAKNCRAQGNQTNRAND